jgi:hypothetical protein
LTSEPVNPQKAREIWVDVMTIVLSVVATIEHWHEIQWKDLMQRTPVGEQLMLSETESRVEREPEQEQEGEQS